MSEDTMNALVNEAVDAIQKLAEVECELNKAAYRYRIAKAMAVNKGLEGKNQTERDANIVLETKKRIADRDLQQRRVIYRKADLDIALLRLAAAGGPSMLSGERHK